MDKEKGLVSEKESTPVARPRVRNTITRIHVLKKKNHHPTVTLTLNNNKLLFLTELQVQHNISNMIIIILFSAIKCSILPWWIIIKYYMHAAFRDSSSTETRWNVFISPQSVRKSYTKIKEQCEYTGKTVKHNETHVKRIPMKYYPPSDRRAQLILKAWFKLARA